MTDLIVIVAVLALTALTGIVSRLGSKKHPEALNTHDDDHVGGPTRDRPGGPGAEPMGVDEPGEPGPGGRS